MANNLSWEIILVGDQSVGKTCMTFRFVENTYKGPCKATVVADIFYKTIKVYDTDVNLKIWDSAGQEIYNAILPQYFRKAQGCILVYDVTRVTTFHSLSKWLSQFRDINETAPVIIVGNKSDSQSKAVYRTTVKSYADQEGLIYTECSAKTGENIDKAFELLFELMWKNQFPEQMNKSSDNPNRQESLNKRNNIIRLSPATKKKSETCGC